VPRVEAVSDELRPCGGVGVDVLAEGGELELELELIQSQMAQKPMLRGEVGAHAWRV
jgi:hypothetical protein